MNETTNPERARRILEKVHKLEVKNTLSTFFCCFCKCFHKFSLFFFSSNSKIIKQRWTATKSKRDSLKSSSKLYEKYKEREGNLNDQITILEEHLSKYRSVNHHEESNDCEWVCKSCKFFVFFLFIYSSS